MKIIWTTNLAQMIQNNCIQKSVGKEAIWKTHCKWGDNIKMYLENVEWDCVNWIDFVHNTNDSGLCENVTLI